MTCYEILTKANDIIVKNNISHRESADLFWFLAFPGFATMHEFSQVEEGYNQRNLKKFIISYCDKPVFDYIPEDGSIFKQIIGNTGRFDNKDVKGIIKKVWKSYLDWERATLSEFEQAYVDLGKTGDTAAQRHIGILVDGVHAELAKIQDYWLAYEAMGWDLPQIRGEQDTIEEKYINEIREMHLKYPKLHHWNSAV